MVKIIEGAIAAGAPLSITYLKADDTEIACTVTPLSVGPRQLSGQQLSRYAGELAK